MPFLIPRTPPNMYVLFYWFYYFIIFLWICRLRYVSAMWGRRILSGNNRRLTRQANLANKNKNKMTAWFFCSFNEDWTLVTFRIYRTFQINYYYYFFRINRMIIRIFHIIRIKWKPEHKIYCWISQIGSFAFCTNKRKMCGSRKKRKGIERE